MNVIEIKNLTKDFRSDLFAKKRRALNNISLEIKEGEIFGYLGPNGAGKTTTLKIIVGLLFPTSGCVRLLGKTSYSSKSRQGMGFLPENPYFYEYLTAGEYLKFCGQLFGLKKNRLKEKIDEVLKLVHLEREKETHCRKLSKGMIQRLGVAQSLLNDPDVLIYDEPLSGLDPIGRKSVREIILNLKKRGKAVFLSSHIISDLEMLCDRVAIIVAGEIKSVGALPGMIEAKHKYTEVVSENLSEATILRIKELANTAVELFNTKVSIKVSDEKEVGRIIDIVREQRARVISVSPARYSLEDMLVEQIKIKG
ncbi:MAG: ABC transporter ATP-binding protein [Candidatus Omnitrophica bacterium]|nr:ABC transporter ATP-binding protein [Candidatus Omnitrophota bacterium]